LDEVGWERHHDGTPVRVIRDGETGRTWRVRRAWQVPDDWARMTAPALIRLAEACVRAPERERVAPRRPLTIKARPTNR
jgi:hypothetical protein